MDSSDSYLATSNTIIKAKKIIHRLEMINKCPSNPNYNHILHECFKLTDQADNLLSMRTRAPDLRTLNVAIAPNGSNSKEVTV